MLPRAQRYDLRHDRDFFYSTRPTAFLAFLFYVKNTAPETSAQSAIIIKKTLGKATQRNYVKRRMAHLLSPLLARSNGKAIVIVVRRLPTEKEYDQVTQKLEQIL